LITRKIILTRAKKSVSGSILCQRFENQNNINYITHRGGTLFVGTYTGIFHSLDGGSTWVNLNANLTNPAISHIGFNASKIFICSQNVAIYVRDLQQVLSLEALASNNELSIYPNPAHEKLTVSLPENSSKTEGILLDNAGKELQRFLLNSDENTLDINHLESGIYFLEINGQSTKFIKN
jgi:ligand-binding sensor domain-containing protein